MSDDRRLADLLIRWEEQCRQGAAPSVERLCAEFPYLTERLESRIRVLRKMESVLGMAVTELPDPHELGEQTDSEAVADTSLPSIPEYEVLDVLGHGGMGVVYRARQLALGRVVAVKMLKAKLVSSRQLERFLDEARAIAHLRHPNIVQIYDFGRDDDTPFFVMEFVEGGNLQNRLADGPLEIGRAVHLTEVIARAIQTVHCAGFAHRDLKPANILLTEDGQPKVSDFGISKRLDDTLERTRTGEVLGTVGYMAPEQLGHSNDGIGPQTDVYALGTLLYEMLTGRRAFSSRPAVALQQVLQNELVPPTRLRANLPRDVEAICLKCLEQNIDDRYVTAEALADDLRRFTEHRPIVARRSSLRRRFAKCLRRRPQIGLLLLVLILAATAWPMISIVGQRREHNERRAQAIRVAPQVREILERNCYSCHGADSRDIRKELNVLDHGLLLDSDRRIVVPGAPQDSRLMQRIIDGSMPPEELETNLPRLTDRELQIMETWIVGGAPAFTNENAQEPSRSVVPYSRLAAEAKEVFQDHCYECHRYDVAKGGIKILHHRLLVDVRQVVVPGQPEDSELFLLITSQDDENVMPPSPRKRLNRAEVEIIRRWILDGARPFPRSIIWAFDSNSS